MSSEAAASCRGPCARQLLARSDSERSTTATECAFCTPEGSLEMETPGNNAREADHCPPLRNIPSSTARHLVTQAHLLACEEHGSRPSPASVPLSHIEEFFGIPQPLLMAQRSPERTYRCSQDGLSGPARLEASLPYRTGNNEKLEEVMGALVVQRLRVARGGK
jgi:hypothetical protein